MIKWGTLRSQITTSVLKDLKGSKYSADQLRVWARWALVEASYHTAETASLIFACDGTTYQFPLPGDIIDTLEKTGLVGWDNGKSVTYLESLRQRPGSEWPDLVPVTLTGSMLAQSDSLASMSSRTTYKTPGFWEWPTSTLTLSFIPEADTRLIVKYFKFWTPPDTDEDNLYIPVWMEKPVAYFIAASAMDPKGVSASDIRQWNDKQQSGNPEDNPLLRQAEFFIKSAHRLLALQPAQDRETFYRANTANERGYR